MTGRCKHSIRKVMVFSRDSQIIGLWLQSQASPHTRGCYGRDFGRLLEHVRKPLSRISLGDLQGFAQALIDDGLAPISRARTIAAIKSLFGFCHRMRYLPINPAAELALPRYENRLAERVLSEEDVQRLLVSDANGRDRILLKLLYFAGLRVSEACNLRWRNLHIRGDAGQVTVFGKGGRTRSILVPAGLWSELVSLRRAAASEDAGLSVAHRKAARPRARPHDRAPGGRASWRCRCNQRTLASTRPRQPRARQWRAHPSRSSHARPQFGRDHERLPPRPPWRLQRALPGPGKISAKIWRTGLAFTAH